MKSHQTERFKKLALDADDLNIYIDNVLTEKTNDIYEQCKLDVSAQLMAVICNVLYKNYSFDKEQLSDFKLYVEDTLKLMNDGLFDGMVKYSPVDCINYMKEKFDIDFDN